MGRALDGSDSKAVETAPQSHWPELHTLICVVSDAKKGTSSTSGMQRTVETSPLLQHRIGCVVPQRMKDIFEAIRAKDFTRFAEITMADSNQFHAVALDTFPPIFYLNDTSRTLITLITEWNRASGEIRGAYTFDAGPDCVCYVRKEHVKELIDLVVHYFRRARTSRTHIRSTTSSSLSVPFRTDSTRLLFLNSRQEL
jgi:diphosphomevalonate decarboxylase